MRILASFFLFLSISIPLLSQTVPLLSEPINADGILSESGWEKATLLEDFQNYFPINEGPASMPTQVLIFHDGQFLNIAFTYADTLPAVRVNSLKRDDYGAGFHLSDCVGIIIDPYSNQNRGYFFALNGEGTQLDGLIANFDQENLSWDALWESGHRVEGNQKIYEFKIPLSTFSYEETIQSWSFQFYTRDAKAGMYTVWNKFQRGFLQFDTRFLRPLVMEDLKPSKLAKTMIIPSVTVQHQRDLEDIDQQTIVQPSLDAQYKMTDGLRLDATINPDFSQVDVDQQVTNLTRFNIVFPERRNFFIENSDMFTTLGLANNINPFFSRFIGADQPLLLGLKLSGNLAPNTRMGLLNVQTKKGDQESAQNYAIASLKQQWNPIFNTTAYLVNRQETQTENDPADYNRVTGIKTNYLSPNRRWSGFVGYSHSFNPNTDGQGQAFSLENNYNTRLLSFSTKLCSVGRNYLTDIGFVPRINNFDALTGETIRSGYTQFSQRILLNIFPEKQKPIQTYRVANASVDAYWDESGDLFEVNYFFNTALFFSNLMSTYLNIYHDQIDLPFAFDPLRNEDFILPGRYANSALRVGFNSDYTQKIYGSINYQWGSFYGGKRQRFATNGGFRFLPFLSLSVHYEYNALDFEDQGIEALHLYGFTTEVFFSNKLNWTTYIQYNQQIDNFNINSRLQWEYQPLSFVYLVFTDNYTEAFAHKNWAIRLKINKRFNF